MGYFKYSILICLLLLNLVALAEDNQTIELEDWVIIGSRHQGGRSVRASPVPIDVLDNDELRSYGATDISSQLAKLIPSYNINEQPISDAATFIRPANLRGLPPDSTLVMINGKRRHRAAVITLLGGGISNGAHGADISTIPAIALKRIEVLRDGASAQYGSDAIAGVLNFELKDANNGGSIDTNWGQFYRGDGESLNVAANIGLPLFTDAGFANLSLEFRQAEATSRSVQRTNAQKLIARGNTHVRNPAQIWGTPEIRDDYKFFGNAGFKFNENLKVYGFGNYAERDIENGFFFRSPGCGNDGLGCSPRTGVFVNGDRTLALPGGSGQTDFRDLFPGGFTPQFGGVLVDYSIAGGVRGKIAGDWSYDASAVHGRNKVDFFLRNTVNPQLITRGKDIPTKYTLGSHVETETSYNLDFSKPVDLAILASPLYVSFGGEYRQEEFEALEGEKDSWYVDLKEYNGKTLAEWGYGIGANGFVGFSPDAASSNERDNWAVYLDLETNVLEDVLVGTAVRYEDYDDFKETVNGKISSLWQVSDPLAFRASFSTGFRVPTVGQANLRSITTEFSEDKLKDSLIAPVDHPIAQAAGAKSLEPEESIHLSAGIVLNLGAADITIDYYHIEVEDRIALTPNRTVVNNLEYASVRYFANAFDTTTQGVDVVATYPMEWLNGETLFSAIGNWTDTSIDTYDRDIIEADSVRLHQIEEGLPEFRFTLEAKHTQGPWQFSLRGLFYDGFYEAHTDSPSTIIEAKPRWFMDTEVAYTLKGLTTDKDNITLALGAKNLFDEYPSKNPHSGRTGSKYPESSPYGFNGGFYYLRANYSF